MDEMESCSLCFDALTDKNRPRVLPCGHTYCTCCISNLIQKEQVKCPNCQRCYNASTPEDIPINYAMENILSEVKKINTGTAAATSPAENSCVSENKTEVGNLISKQKLTMKNRMIKSDELGSQLTQYHIFLMRIKMKQEKVSQMIFELSKIHNNHWEEINKEITKIDDTRKERNNYRKKMEDSLNRADEVKYDRDAYAALANLFHISEDHEEWLQAWRDQIPNGRVVTSEKFLDDTEKSLSEILLTRNDVPEHLHWPMDITVMDRIDMLNSDIKARDLRLNAMHWKKLIGTGKVHAIHSIDGNDHYARISSENSKIYLHHLENYKKSKPEGWLVEQTELLKIFHEEDSVMAFLDLAWNGYGQGRIIVHLQSLTPLAKQFKVLCTGEKGYTYANSNFTKTESKGKPVERIIGGDYLDKNGRRGAPVFSELDVYDRKYIQVGVKTGAVYAHHDNKKSSMFGILSGEGNMSGFFGVFGQVTEGIEVVKAAAKLGDIRKVKIIDCGVVINL